MPSIEKNLLSDEQILYRTKKHYIIFFTPVVLFIASFFFFFNPNPLIGKVGFLPLLAAVLTGINQYLIYLSSDFVLTTRRILMQEGFFYKHTNEMRLATIANINVNQSLLGQALNYGTVIVHAFGGDPDPFTEIASPNEFQRQVQEQLDKVERPKI